MNRIVSSAGCGLALVSLFFCCSTAWSAGAALSSSSSSLNAGEKGSISYNLDSSGEIYSGTIIVNYDENQMGGFDLATNNLPADATLAYHDAGDGVMRISFISETPITISSDQPLFEMSYEAKDAGNGAQAAPIQVATQMGTSVEGEAEVVAPAVTSVTVVGTTSGGGDSGGTMTGSSSSSDSGSTTTSSSSQSESSSSVSSDSASSSDSTESASSQSMFGSSSDGSGGDGFGTGAGSGSGGGSSSSGFAVSEKLKEKFTPKTLAAMEFTKATLRQQGRAYAAAVSGAAGSSGKNNDNKGWTLPKAQAPQLTTEQKKLKEKFSVELSEGSGEHVTLIMKLHVPFKLYNFALLDARLNSRKMLSDDRIAYDITRNGAEPKFFVFIGDELSRIDLQ